ncbi:MAG TPA: hypothetical protein VM008_21440 [Phycisphaerae bacterium]|nr:hypothetical protein [Phycisphaerae bacterium]
MNTTPEPLSHLHRLWDLGQRHLAGGRYVAARRALESAEAIAWRQRDARSLARIYLPLLEARRQIRYNAAEGTLVLLNPTAPIHEQQKKVRDFLHAPAGTILLPASSASPNHLAAGRLAASIQYESRRTGRWLEALLLLQRGIHTRLASPADPTFAAGLPVQFTTNTTHMIGSSTDLHLTVPLPPPGIYTAKTGGGLHALLRESLLIAPEALALSWQHRHSPLRSSDPWQELAWLRRALQIDPACEPISMRLIALAEAIERT